MRGYEALSTGGIIAGYRILLLAEDYAMAPALIMLVIAHIIPVCYLNVP